MSDIPLFILFFSPMLVMIGFGIREWLRSRRLEEDEFSQWWPWIRFTEPQPSQQKHVPRGQYIKTTWGVFRLDEKRVCRFRLRFGATRLGTIGQIVWDGHEIHVEGRISRFTLATPLITGLWMAILLGAIYLRTTASPKLWPLVALVAGITVGIAILIGLTGLMQALLERSYFFRAYREIKARIWEIN